MYNANTQRYHSNILVPRNYPPSRRGRVKQTPLIWYFVHRFCDNRTEQAYYARGEQRYITSHRSYDILYLGMFRFAGLHGGVVNGHTVLTYTLIVQPNVTVLLPSQALHDDLMLGECRILFSRFFQ